MKDFLGNDFEVGDTIVYPKMSGRSVALCQGVVLKFNESGSVTVQPMVESWDGGRERSGTTRYIDTRTGKGFSPYADSAKKHMERPWGYKHKVTDKWISYEEYHAMNDDRRVYQTEAQREYTWASVIWKDYVKKETTVKPVTITRTDNIILVKKAGDA